MNPHQTTPPRVIAWELTRACPLKCRHCRASSRTEPSERELSTDECFTLIDNISALAKPILILTGGEPMLRDDVWDIASYATRKGLHVALATCGMLVDEQSVRRMKESGVRRVSISIDGATSESHDRFRQSPGSFEACIRATRLLRKAGVDFQINTTVSKYNVEMTGEILDLAKNLGASVFNPFLLVPTGRGKALKDLELSAQEYERTLHWFASQRSSGIALRVTCAPHYQRIIHQLGTVRGPANRGCLGGKSFAFISHVGVVQICGFLDVPCGNLRETGMDFTSIWRDSPMLKEVRNVDSYKGKCGRCEFRVLCSGCRARAMAKHGDYLASEPYCTYQPKPAPTPKKLDNDDLRLISLAHRRLPLSSRPFRELGAQLDMSERDVISRLRRLSADGTIRRIGAVFDAKRLGYVSTLITAATTDTYSIAPILEHPGVTHCYTRAGSRYDLWFTLTMTGRDALLSAMDELSRSSGLTLAALRATRIYKSRVVFHTLGQYAGGHGNTGPEPQTGKVDGVCIYVDDMLRRVIYALCGSLSITPRPFAELVDGVDEETVISNARRWLDEGVIKRIAVIPAHRRVGVVANALCAFEAGARADQIGTQLAALPEVTHCYLRDVTPLPGWRWNLFAMFHGRSERELHELVNTQARRLGADVRILPTHAELKKTSLRLCATGQP